MSDIDAVIQHLSTVRDFIRWGASCMNEAEVYFGHGTDNAIDEAASLVLHALHLPADLHDEYFQAVLTPAERRAVVALLNRRVRERKPAAYLMNRAWFMDLPFYVDERVLIPRSPMAELIESRFAPWLKNPDAVEHILDLCAGSGCLGIACAYVFEDAEVDLADVSAGALAVAQRNVEEHGLEDRVETIHSDLFSALGGRRYDLILSNPPYVSEEEIAGLPPEYRHEPTLGLMAGADGLDVVAEILRRAADFLSEEGLLVVEVGTARYALEEAFPDAPFTWIEFERGGEGVFVLSAGQLRACRDMF